MYRKQQTSDHQQFWATSWQLLLEMHSSFSTNWSELQSIPTKECNPNVLRSFYPKGKQQSHKKTRYSFLCSYVYLFVCVWGWIHSALITTEEHFLTITLINICQYDFQILLCTGRSVFLNIIMNHFLKYLFHNWRWDNSCTKVAKLIFMQTPAWALHC